MSNSALLIGFGKYNNIDCLTSAENNLNIVESVLSNGADDIRAYSDVDVLLNEGLETVAERISQFSSNRNAKDRLLLYVMGHGHVSENYSDLHILTEKWSADNQTRLHSVKFIEDILVPIERSNATSKAIVLDCCHAGFSELAAGDLLPQGQSMRSGNSFDPLKAFEKKALAAEQPRGTVILRSSAADMPSWEYAAAENEEIGHDMVWSLVCDELGISPQLPVSVLVKNIATIATIKKVHDSVINDETIKSEVKTLISRAHSAVRSDNDGLLPLMSACDGLRVLLDSETVQQEAGIFGKKSVAFDIPLARIDETSRSEKLVLISEFVSQMQGITDASRNRLQNFLESAVKLPKHRRLNTDYLLEKRLYEAVKKGSEIGFIETFLSYDLEVAIRKEGEATRELVQGRTENLVQGKDREIAELIENIEKEQRARESAKLKYRNAYEKTKKKMKNKYRLYLFSIVIVTVCAVYVAYSFGVKAGLSPVSN